MKPINEMTTEEIKTEIKTFINSKFKKDENYIFVSYSHKDNAVVMKKVLQWIRDGYNVIMDLDFENHGSEQNWVDLMGRRLRSDNCVQAVCFRGQHYYHSYASLIELLLLRSKYLERKRAAGTYTEIPIDIVDIPDEDEDKIDAFYCQEYNRLKEEVKNNKFFSGKESERTMLLEGLKTLCDKMNERGYDENPEEMISDFEEAFSDGYKNFYNRIRYLFDLWFKCNDMNGNFKKLDYEANNVFDDHKVYRFHDYGCDDDKKSSVKMDVLPELKEKYENIAVDSNCMTGMNQNIKQEQPISQNYENATRGAELTDKNMKKKHLAVNVKKDGENTVPYVDNYDANITKKMTLAEFARLFDDDKFVYYLRNLRASGGEKYNKQMFDYTMAALLRGCDVKLKMEDARWKYCVYAVASKTDLDNPQLGSSQFTWQSNSRKAVEISGSGKLGENSEIFANISEDTTIEAVERMFVQKEKGFITKSNAQIENVFRALYSTAR